MQATDARGVAAGGSVVHWYDFVCPFCYVAQSRNDTLRAAGAKLVECPYEAHPETPLGGRHIGPRVGAMYAFIEREAEAAGLDLQWPPRIPNARLALTAAAFVEARGGPAADRFRARVFSAHFTRGEDIGDPACIEACAADVEIDVAALRSSLGNGAAAGLLAESALEAHRRGVQGTPAWFIGGALVTGLRTIPDLLAEVRRGRM